MTNFEQLLKMIDNYSAYMMIYAVELEKSNNIDEDDKYWQKYRKEKRDDIIKFLALNLKD